MGNNLIQFIFSSLLMLCITSVHAELLTSRQENLTVDKITQTELLNKQLAELDKLYGATSALLKNLDSQTAKQKQDLAKIQAEIAALNSELKKQNDDLAGQVKTMYAMGHKERIKLLLNQEDPILTSRMMAYYDYLNTKRVNQLGSTIEMLQRLEHLKKENETQTAQLEQNLSQKRLEQNAADALRKQRAQLLKNATPDFLSNEQQINRLKDSEIALKNLLSNVKTSSSDLQEEIAKARSLRQKRLQAQEEVALQSLPLKTMDEDTAITVKQKEKHTTISTAAVVTPDVFPSLEQDFASLKGKLSFPVKGEILKKFGSAREDGKLDGVIIAAQEGTDIQSITDGKVVYADWMRGYGLLIIVDHGKGYISLYAFNQSLYKKVGDIVNAGDVIASVGLSGGHDRASLYFGIRKKGKALDPLEWCR